MADDKCSRKRADFSTSNSRIDAMIEDSNVYLWPEAADGLRSTMSLKVLFSKVDRRLDADTVEVGFEPIVGARSPHLPKSRQKIPVAVQSARPRQLSDQVFGFDQVDKHALAPSSVPASMNVVR
jgi:hypothetical protein